MGEKKVYFNKPQHLTQLIGANTTFIVAGRRTGKTDSIAAPFVLRNIPRMPGSEVRAAFTSVPPVFREDVDILPAVVYVTLSYVLWWATIKS